MTQYVACRSCDNACLRRFREFAKRAYDAVKFRITYIYFFILKQIGDEMSIVFR